MPRPVVTNVDPEDMNDSLLDTFNKWVNFALGEGSLGGETLTAPSGRLAAALRAETDKDGNIVAIYINKEEIGAITNNFLISGHKSFSLKSRMLKLGLPGVHQSKPDKLSKKNKKRYLYRYIPISDNPIKPLEAFTNSKNLVNLFTSEVTSQGGILRLNRNAARIWTKNYQRAHTGTSKIRTMSNRPGSAAWRIPAMPAFNITKLLQDMLPPEAKGRVII